MWCGVLAWTHLLYETIWMIFCLHAEAYFYAEAKKNHSFSVKICKMIKQN